MTDTANHCHPQPEPDTKVAKSPALSSYQRSEAEESIINKLGEQMRAQIRIPQLKESQRDQSIVFDHPNQATGWGLLMNALGTTDINFAHGIVRRLANFTAIDGQIDEANLNFALSIVASTKPNDEQETLLAVLQVETCLSAGKMASLLYHGETTGELEQGGNGLNKCARTYALLSETLIRKRSGCQQNQNFTVQNVSVRDNAQAVVTGPRSKAPPKGA
jgi:hypothetical protein